MASNKKRRQPIPLERSSYEFMAALVMATITQLIPNWIAYMCLWTVLAGVAVYFCCYSRGTVDYGRLRKLFLSVCCIAFIFSMSYSQVVNRFEEENVIPPAIQYMTAWGEMPGAPQLVVSGTPPHVVSGIPSGTVTVDGRLLDKYKKKFELMAVLLHVMNGESYMDKKDLSKSRLVKIRPEDLIIKVNFDTQFLEEMTIGATGQTYVLLAMPRGLNPEDFGTLNDAEDKGAQIIGQGTAVGQISMPPK